MPHHDRISALLQQSARSQIAGRGEELERLLAVFRAGGPPVTHVSGIAGIGKSSLMALAATHLADRRIECVQIECRSVEPTEIGFCEALSARLKCPDTGPAGLASELASRDGWVALILDSYEHFLLLDTWLRGSFVPLLLDNVRVFLIGRLPPPPRWLTEPGWQGLFQSITLGPLAEADAGKVLVRLGMTRDAALRVARFAHGHPLALRLLASIAGQRSDLQLGSMDLQQALQRLSQIFLDDVHDPNVRTALEAVSVVRRITAPLLGRLVPGANADRLYVQLSTLPFIDVCADGLMLHEVVRSAIADALRARDPARFLECRCQAWRQLCGEAGPTGRSELWRYTADMLFLIENPVVRGAFFPVGAPRLSVAPMRGDERPAVLKMIAAHEPAAAATALEAWLAQLPQCFSTAHGDDAAVCGVYIACDAQRVPASLLATDAVAASWLSHLQQEPIAAGERALFCRRWLSRTTGEAPSDEQAAIWLDLKRVYMEMRPNLRRVYLTVTDLSPYAPAAMRLGFSVLPACEVVVSGVTYQTAMLDFGPESVDGWLAGLAADELGIERDTRLLNESARELVVAGRRTPLTPLEFGVMQHLSRHAGQVVSRRDLLQHVWGTEYLGGSNVVDSVVRGLRRKLREKAQAVETVTGVGYRLRS